MESDFFGLIVWDPGQLIVSALIVALGVWILNSAGGSALKTLGGALLAGIGAFSVLDSLYLQGFRWLNTLLLAIIVIVIGIALVRAAGIVMTILGVLLIIFAIAALDGLPLFNDLQLQGTLGEIWNSAKDSFNRLFNGQASPIGSR